MKLKKLLSLFSLSFVLFLVGSDLKAQVWLRDTIVSWQNHAFQLNEDGSMNNFTTADNNIESVQFNGKVIENELIKLTVLPEYGARVISFIYKPTGHEQLYQSECGSPYGIGDGNFYFDWLMVYGGIFPTFPEPEHGKTWFLPWEYSVIHQNADSVGIAMEYADNTSYSGAPGKFNNGITGITCRIEIKVFRASSIWDFNVQLINNKNEFVDYEYWTCTTLTPGSEPENTGSPLNSEMIVPIEQYEAAWSPGSWIGSYGRLYDYTNINHLSKWRDMGIAYAHNLNDNHWGVINHENEEGIFRISPNIETPGMKFWTWGKNNIDNNLFDFSNGGADNYIELWAGTSEAFFTDATLSPNEIKSWEESYVPTVGLTSLAGINNELALNVEWETDQKKLYYQVMDFWPGRELQIEIILEGSSVYSVLDKTFISGELGNLEGFSIGHVPDGNYLAKLYIYNSANKLLITASKELALQGTGLNENYNIFALQVYPNPARKYFFIEYTGIPDGIIKIELIDVQGKLVYMEKYNSAVNGNIRINPNLRSGIYFVRLTSGNKVGSQRLIIQ